MDAIYTLTEMFNMDLDFKEPKFIVVDGMDGIGKTSIVTHIRDLLNRQSKLPVRQMRALGQGPIGLACRERHLHSKSANGFESLMMPMSIIEAYNDFVIPTLEDGCHVVMDRWIGSFYAYQVTARQDKLASMVFEDFFCKENVMPRWPDLYIIGDADLDVAENRMSQRQDATNYLDQETRDFKSAVKQGFKNFHLRNFYRAALLDCNPSFDEVTQSVNTLLNQLEK